MTVEESVLDDSRYRLLTFSGGDASVSKSRCWHVKQEYVLFDMTRPSSKYFATSNNQLSTDE